MKCPHCNETTTPPPRPTLFFCRSCGGLINMQRPRDGRPIPVDSFDVFRRDDAGPGRDDAPEAELIIVHRWHEGGAISRVVFPLVAVLFALMAIGFANGVRVNLLSGRLVATVAFLGFTLLAGSFAYLAAALRFNRTALFVDPAAIERQIGPLPWRGGGTIRQDDIRELRVETRSSMKMEEVPLHELRIITCEGNVVTLLAGRPEPHIYRQIARLISDGMSLEGLVRLDVTPFAGSGPSK